MQYSDHARAQMQERRITEAEVEATLANPHGTWGPTKRGSIEHFGTTSDGRVMSVVTNAESTLIVTVIA